MHLRPPSVVKLQQNLQQTAPRLQGRRRGARALRGTRTHRPTAVALPARPAPTRRGAQPRPRSLTRAGRSRRVCSVASRGRRMLPGGRGRPGAAAASECAPAGGRRSRSGSGRQRRRRGQEPRKSGPEAETARPATWPRGGRRPPPPPRSTRLQMWSRRAERRTRPGTARSRSR